jgi:hypothetical protein
MILACAQREDRWLSERAASSPIEAGCTALCGRLGQLPGDVLGGAAKSRAARLGGRWLEIAGWGIVGAAVQCPCTAMNGSHWLPIMASVLDVNR